MIEVKFFFNLLIEEKPMKFSNQIKKSVFSSNENCLFRRENVGQLVKKIVVIWVEEISRKNVKL